MSVESWLGEDVGADPSLALWLQYRCKVKRVKALHIFLSVLWALVLFVSTCYFFCLENLLEYLTLWAIVVHLVFNMAQAVVDSRPASQHTVHNSGCFSVSLRYPINAQDMWLKRWVDSAFSLLFPLANMVGLVFWAVLAPYLLQAGSGWTGGSSWSAGWLWLLMFFQHGLTWMAVWLEAYLVHHHFKSVKQELLVLNLFALVYLLFNFCWRFTSPYQWVYPFQGGHSVGVDVLIYTGLFLAANLFYLLCRWAQRRMWQNVDAPQALLEQPPTSQNVAYNTI